VAAAVDEPARQTIEQTELMRLSIEDQGENFYDFSAP